MISIADLLRKFMDYNKQTTTVDGVYTEDTQTIHPTWDSQKLDELVREKEKPRRIILAFSDIALAFLLAFSFYWYFAE